MPIRRTFPGVVIAAALAGCAPRTPERAASPMTVDTAAVVSAVGAYWQRWVAAATAGDVTAMGALMTDSVRIDSKGLPPMIGKAAWATVFEPMLKTTKVDSEVITPEITTAVSNELAYQTGNYVEATTTAGKSQTDYGRYAAAIRKDSDSQWRLVYIMAFADSLVPVKK